MSRTHIGGTPSMAPEIAVIDANVDYIESNVANTPRITGKYYFVSKNGDDANDGLSPDTAWLTIAKAGTVAGDGDSIRVGAGTYVENGIEISGNQR